MKDTLITKEVFSKLKLLIKNSREWLSIYCFDFKSGWEVADENKATISAGRDDLKVSIEFAVDMIDYSPGKEKPGMTYRLYSSLLCYSATARTFFRSIKVGDEVRIRFIRGNDNNTMREKGMTQSEVRGIIQRKNEIFEYSLENEILTVDNPWNDPVN